MRVRNPTRPSSLTGCQARIGPYQSRRETIWPEAGKGMGIVMGGASRRVRFTGSSQRSGPLTMGQSNMLLCMKTDKPAHINVSAVWELPPGTDLDRIAETLVALHARHETLRTTFPA